MNTVIDGSGNATLQVNSGASISGGTVSLSSATDINVGVVSGAAVTISGAAAASISLTAGGTLNLNAPTNYTIGSGGRPAEGRDRRGGRQVVGRRTQPGGEQTVRGSLEWCKCRWGKGRSGWRRRAPLYKSVAFRRTPPWFRYSSAHCPVPVEPQRLAVVLRHLHELALHRHLGGVNVRTWTARSMVSRSCNDA